MIAAAFLAGVAVGIAVLAVCIMWDRQAALPKPMPVRRESMSERHDRLDREAFARTRPTSSNRKSGRGSL